MVTDKANWDMDAVTKLLSSNLGVKWRNWILHACKSVPIVRSHLLNDSFTHSSEYHWQYLQLNTHQRDIAYSTATLACIMRTRLQPMQDTRTGVVTEPSCYRTFICRCCKQNWSTGKATEGVDLAVIADLGACGIQFIASFTPRPCWRLLGCSLATALMFQLGTFCLNVCKAKLYKCSALTFAVPEFFPSLSWRLVCTPFLCTRSYSHFKNWLPHYIQRDSFAKFQVFLILSLHLGF